MELVDSNTDRCKNFTIYIPPLNINNIMENKQFEKFSYTRNGFLSIKSPLSKSFDETSCDLKSDSSSVSMEESPYLSDNELLTIKICAEPLKLNPDTPRNDNPSEILKDKIRKRLSGKI
jgi:hypothetical protein